LNKHRDKKEANIMSTKKAETKQSIKISLLGKQGSGKTQLAKKIANPSSSAFFETYKPTLGADTIQTTFPVDRQDVFLYDMSGDPKYDALNNAYLAASDIILITVDLSKVNLVKSNKETQKYVDSELSYLKPLLQQAKQIRPKDAPFPQIMVVGTKDDTKKSTSETQKKAFLNKIIQGLMENAQDLGIHQSAYPFFTNILCSAKEGVHIQEIGAQLNYLRGATVKPDPEVPLANQIEPSPFSKLEASIQSLDQSKYSKEKAAMLFVIGKLKDFYHNQYKKDLTPFLTKEESQKIEAILAQLVEQVAPTGFNSSNQNPLSEAQLRQQLTEALAPFNASVDKKVILAGLLSFLIITALALLLCAAIGSGVGLFAGIPTALGVFLSVVSASSTLTGSVALAGGLSLAASLLTGLIATVFTTQTIQEKHALDFSSFFSSKSLEKELKPAMKKEAPQKSNEEIENPSPASTPK